MKCPSCNAQVDQGAGVCQNCGHKFDAGSPKRTMMGLPSITDDGGNANDEPTQERNRSTLFGIPAVSNQDEQPEDEPSEHERPAGLAESTAPAEVDEATNSEADASTRVVSDLDLGQALGQAVDDADAGGRGKHQTAFGLPSPKEKQEDVTEEADALDEVGAIEDGDVASAWGLAEESSEETHSATQVAGAALADAILESKQGATGFSKTSGDADPIRGTLMGMSRDDIDEQESTREVSREQLNAVREAAARNEKAKAQSTPEPEPAEPEPPFEEDEDTTQALGPDELAEFEERIQSDRRKQLLNKLRPKAKSNKSSTTGASTSGPSNLSSQGQPDSGQPDRSPPGQGGAEQAPAEPNPPTPQSNRRPTGPRFSIPTPGQQAQETAEEPQELTVEPIDEPAEEPKPGFGSGQTSFPISAGGKSEGGPSKPARDLSDDELEIALGDTGVVSGDDASGAMDQAFGDSTAQASGAGGGIHEFHDDDSDAGESIFPIDDVDEQTSSSGEVDLSADFEPSIPAQSLQNQQDAPHAPQRSEVNFGATPASGTEVPPQQPAPQSPSPQAQQGQHQPLPQSQGQQQFQQQQQQAQQPSQQQQQAQQSQGQQQLQHQQQPQQADPAASLIKTVQAIFGILGALFLIGAGAYGYFTSASDDLVQQAIIGAPALVGLLTVLVSVLPLSNGLQSGGFFLVGALAAGALTAGVIFSASTGALLLVLGGLLLVLCAAAFPLVLKVVQ